MPPEDYYPEGYHSELLPQWPVSSDLVVPMEALPPAPAASFRENWRYRKSYRKHVSELCADTE